MEGAGASARDHPGRLLEPGAVRVAGRAARPRRRPPGARAASLLPGRRAALLCPDREVAGGGRAGRGRRSADPPDDREAVRARPRLGAGAEPPGGLRLRRVAGVPPRSLSRQGDGAEPPGAAVRQRHPGADLESPLRRARPDHRRGRPRDRPSRGLLRLGRRDSGRDPEPRHAAPCPGGDGGPGALRRRHDPRREGEAAALGSPLQARGRPGLRRPRPVRRRLGRRGGGSGVSGRGGRRRRFAHRHLRRAAGRDRQLALGGDAVLRPHRQAAAATGDRDRDPLPARAAPALRERGDRRRGAQRAGALGAAGRGSLAAPGRQGSRARR